MDEDLFWYSVLTYNMMALHLKENSNDFPHQSLFTGLEE